MNIKLHQQNGNVEKTGHQNNTLKTLRNTDYKLMLPTLVANPGVTADFQAETTDTQSSVLDLIQQNES